MFEKNPNIKMGMFDVVLRDDITGAIAKTAIRATTEESAVTKIITALHCEYNSNIFGPDITPQGVGNNITAIRLGDAPIAHGGVPAEYLYGAVRIS